MAGYSSNLRFQWRGTSVAAQLEAAIEEAMDETAQAAEVAAKGHARVDTGAMRDSIEASVTRARDAVEMVLSIGVSYGIYHELGTSRISAQPMIRPAIDQEGPKLAGRIRQKVAGIR